MSQGTAALPARAPARGYLLQGLYALHLENWLRFFPRSQMLVLKAEDLFGDPSPVFAATLAFLGLPPWQPEQWRRFNKGSRDLVPEAVRERLREVFRPHNERLRSFAGADFRWE